MALDTSNGIVKPEEGFNVIKAAAEQRASTTFAGIEAHKLMDQQAAAAEEMKSATIAGGLNDATISAAQSSFTAVSDAKKSAENLALGFDPLDQGSKSNYWIREMHDNAAKAYAALDVVNQSASKTLLDDPLGYIAAQFTLPADIAAQHYYVDKYNMAAGSLNQITQASTAASMAIEKSQQTTSTAMASAQADNARQLAAIAAAKIERESAGIQKAGVLEINSLNEKQLAIAVQVHAAQNSDAHLALARQSAADSHKSHMMAWEQRQEQIDAKKATQAELEASLVTRNVGAKIMGRPPIGSVTEFLAENRTQQKNPVYLDMVAAGANSQFNGGNVIGIPIAENAGNAARNYASGGVNLSGNVAGSFLADIWNKQKGVTGAAKDPQALAAQVSEIAVAAAKSELASIDNSNPRNNNIYAAPIPSIVTEIAGVKSNPFLAATVLPLLAQDPKLSISDATMIGKAIDFAKTGSPDTAGMGAKGTFNAAAQGIVTYYSAAVIKNSAINRYEENGLPKQTSYIANINGANYDLTKAADVKRAMFMFDKQNMLGFPIFNTAAKAGASVGYSIATRLQGE